MCVVHCALEIHKMKDYKISMEDSTYLFTVILTSKIKSFPIGCKDFRFLITFSSKYFY